MRLPRSISRSFLSALVLFGALTTSSAVIPGAVYACSCMAPEPIATYKGDPLQEIFVGTVSATGAPGVDVAVEQWFQGRGDRFVRLSAEGFGEQSASCQELPPPIGSRWIWVAYLSEAGAEPNVNLCTPKARLDTPEGAAMLADAQTAFGTGTPVESPPPAEPESPAPTASPVDATALLAPAAAVGLVAVVVFGAVALVARRRTRES